jgi:hypothetical protein
MSRIFISYRRQESIGVAGRIFDSLTAHFGANEVFMDIDAIPPGVDFREHIANGIDKAKVMLVLIGEAWLQLPGPNGRRLDDPDDFVRIELEMAFARNISIIPVLLGHAIMPKAGELPSSITDLAHRNAAHIDMGRDFHPHAKRLLNNIKRHLGHDGVKAAQTLPGEDSTHLIQRYFRECDVYITVSPEYTLITNPTTDLIGFRAFMNSFLTIEQTDNKKRPLIWVLDLGRQKFDDLDARMRFLNVQSLLTRFKALMSFEESGAEERWQWLLSRVVIILLDSRRREVHGEQVKRPTFAAHNVSLTTLDPVWLDAKNFRKLYGNRIERVRQRNFTIFFNASSNWLNPYQQNNELRYFGHAQLSFAKMKTDPQLRGLELPSLPTNYQDAFRVVCAAAAHTLGINYISSNNCLVQGDEATQQLRHLGYVVLRLDEFLAAY